VAITPDGKTIVSGGSDGMVRVWDVQRQRPMGEPFPGAKDGMIFSVAITPDGKTIVSGGSDGMVRVWDFRLDTWLEAACRQIRYHPLLLKSEKARETCKHVDKGRRSISRSL
jgi:WD40 repeat protein